MLSPVRAKMSAHCSAHNVLIGSSPANTRGDILLPVQIPEASVGAIFPALCPMPMIRREHCSRCEKYFAGSIFRSHFWRTPPFRCELHCGRFGGWLTCKTAIMDGQHFAEGGDDFLLIEAVPILQLTR
jgi:hypothetical protein